MEPLPPKNKQNYSQLCLVHQCWKRKVSWLKGTWNTCGGAPTTRKKILETSHGMAIAVKSLNREYCSLISEAALFGDLTMRWRVAHVGKVGLLVAIMDLPETDTEVREMLEKKKRELKKSLDKKHGAPAKFLEKMYRLSKSKCPFTKLQSVRWHRLISGCQYSADALSDKCRLQSFVPSEHYKEKGWVPQLSLHISCGRKKWLKKRWFLVDITN